MGPKTYDDLFVKTTYQKAFFNLLCFLPVFFLVVYPFRKQMLSAVKLKHYLKAIGILLILATGGMLINFFMAGIYINSVITGSVDEENLSYRLVVAGWNTRWAVILAIVTLGLHLARVWYLQQRENIAIHRLSAKASMQAQKARIHPEWLFRSLDMIKTNLSTNTSSSANMILNLSDILSYSLYDSEDELVPLEREVAELENLVALEKSDRAASLHIRLNVSGDLSDKYIAPMVVINYIVEHITSLRGSGLTPCMVKIDLRAAHAALELNCDTNCGEAIRHSQTQWPLAMLKDAKDKLNPKDVTNVRISYN
ncbi:MAG: histidine kinase [Flavitalea sp.]